MSLLPILSSSKLLIFSLNVILATLPPYTRLVYGFIRPLSSYSINARASANSTVKRRRRSIQSLFLLVHHDILSNRIGINKRCDHRITTTAQQQPLTEKHGKDGEFVVESDGIVDNIAEDVVEDYSKTVKEAKKEKRRRTNAEAKPTSSSTSSIWEQRFHQLSEYRRIHGNCRVTVNHDDPSLCFWVLRQRRKYQRGNLRQIKIDKLNTLQFEWENRRKTWEERYLELKRFYRMYGDTFVPNDVPDLIELYRWSLQQRFQFKLYEKEGTANSTLNKDQIELLKSIRFCFDNVRQVEAGLWEKRYRDLLSYKATHGDCKVPFFEKGKLGRWAYKQCFLYSMKKLSPTRQRKLEQAPLEVDWFEKKKRRRFTWEERFEQLKEFKLKHGTCNLVPHTGGYKSLYTWIQYQRYQYRLYMSGDEACLLTKEKIEAMIDLGLDLKPDSSARTRKNQALVWDFRMNQLRQFQNIHGHCRVPHNDEKFPQLGLWVTQQRKLARQQKLSQGQITELNDVGFDFQRQHKTWDDRFDQLVEFHRKYGHCRVVDKYNSNDVTEDDDNHELLLEWTWQQRHQYKLFREGKKSFLNQKRVDALKSIGFFDSNEEGLSINKRRHSWQERYNQLKNYQEIHGTTLVPRSYDPALTQWMELQRQAYRLQMTEKRTSSLFHLTEDQISLLNEIDFIWDLKEHKWNENMEKLRSKIQSLQKTKKPKQKLTAVEVLSILDPELQNWMKSTQRQMVRCRNGRSCSLSREQIRDIEKLNLPFLSERKNVTFEERLEELKAYKKQYGNCNVPQHFRDNPSLGLWVKSQRSNYRKMKHGKKSTMTPRRVAELEALGFHWVAPSKYSNSALPDESDTFEVITFRSEKRPSKGDTNAIVGDVDASSDLLRQWREKFNKYQTKRDTV